MIKSSSVIWSCANVRIVNPRRNHHVGNASLPAFILCHQVKLEILQKDGFEVEDRKV